jgi:ribosome-binding protein aMBF1 (putative translation factor)
MLESNMSIAAIQLDGKEYVLLPKAEYLRLLRKAGPAAGSVDAEPYMASGIATNLRKARRAAAMTQQELAARLGKSQAMVSSAERGTVRVGPRYVQAVLKACGLPKTWPK